MRRRFTNKDFASKLEELTTQAPCSMWLVSVEQSDSPDSGFYEEFIRARDRFQKTGKPEIWLFFKSVDSESLNAPGEQLGKALEFERERIEQLV